MLLNKNPYFMHYKKEGKNYMKQSGITRRIDELGRIVIPKEIRKNMHIKTGELLEIYLEKENKIILKKHDIISLKDEFLRSFINNLSLEIKSNVYLTNLNNIIFSEYSLIHSSLVQTMKSIKFTIFDNSKNDLYN